MTEETTIRVLIVDDHTIVRQGIAALLGSVTGIQVLGECAGGLEAITRVRELGPDVVLLDLSLPDMSGIDVVHEIKRDRPDCQVVVLTMHADVEYVRPALRAGVAGYLVKGADIGDLVAAVRAAPQGKVHLSPVVARLLVDVPAEPLAEPLSAREEEVLRLVAAGKTSREVGTILGISPRTVDNHRRRIMEKVGVHDVVSLTRHAIKAGLVSPA